MPRWVPQKKLPPLWVRWLVPGVAAAVCAGLVVAIGLLNPAPGEGSHLDDSVFREMDYVPLEMLWVPNGRFVMGSDDGPEDERPAHEVSINGFWLSKTEVTNGQFALFVKETGYVTVAERKPDPKRYPNADPALLVPGSAVYIPVDAPLYGPWETPHPPWWKYVPGASWRHPDGPDSNIKGKSDYPVVHIAWEDAMAYCKWAKKRLPTEAEWEYAARGGLKNEPFCWGSAKQGEGGQWHANTFQGTFPKHDTGEDGYIGVAPVGRFEPNGYGLFDMSGNVWEWCSDNYDSKYYAISPKKDPPGPSVGEAEDGQPLKVRRGGSYLCADGYCRRYLPAARDKNPADSGASHTGFRVASDVR